MVTLRGEGAGPKTVYCKVDTGKDTLGYGPLIAGETYVVVMVDDIEAANAGRPSGYATGLLQQVSIVIDGYNPRWNWIGTVEMEIYEFWMLGADGFMPDDPHISWMKFSEIPFANAACRIESTHTCHLKMMFASPELQREGSGKNIGDHAKAGTRQRTRFAGEKPGVWSETEKKPGMIQMWKSLFAAPAQNGVEAVYTLTFKPDHCGPWPGWDTTTRTKEPPPKKPVPGTPTPVDGPPKAPPPGTPTPTPGSTLPPGSVGSAGN